MTPILHGKTDIDCCRLGIQEYYAYMYRYKPLAMLIPPL